MNSRSARRWAVAVAAGIVLAVAGWLFLRAASGAFFRATDNGAGDSLPFPPIEADLPGEAEAPRPSGAALATRTVILYFENAEDGEWAAEERVILRSEFPAVEARQALAELTTGPREAGHLPVLPAGTRLIHLLLSADGTAYADFSRRLAEPGELGGSDAELRAIGAIVRTLTENFAVSRVRILIEGKERETLYGHVALAGAFRAGRVLAEAPAP